MSLTGCSTRQRRRRSLGCLKTPSLVKLHWPQAPLSPRKKYVEERAPPSSTIKEYHLILHSYLYQVAKTAYAIFVREQWNKIKKVTDSLGETSAAIARQWKALTDNERAHYAQRLLDEQLLVQNLTDSYFQQDPDVYMKSLLGSCGKLQLLDRMLPVLKSGSHKVLHARLYQLYLEAHHVVAGVDILTNDSAARFAGGLLWAESILVLSHRWQRVTTTSPSRGGPTHNPYIIPSSPNVVFAS